MKYKLYLVLGLFFLSTISLANQRKIDSLKSVIESYKSNESILDALLDLSRLYTINNNFDSAVFYYNEALDEAIVLKKVKEQSQIYKDLGVIYEMQGDYDKAMKYQYKALGIAEKSNDYPMQSAIMVNIGIVNFNLKRADDAIQCNLKAIELAKQANDTVRWVLALNNLGNTYLTLKLDLDKAEEYFNQTIEFGREIEYYDAVKVGLTNLTQIAINRGQLDKAIDYAEQVYAMNIQNPFALYNLGSIYYMNNKADTAVKLMLQAFNHCKEEAELSQVILKDISAIYKSNHQYDSALKYFEIFTQLKDSTHNLESLKNINELNTKYELGKKENQILLLELDKRKRNNLILILATALILLAIGLVFIFNTIRQRRIIAQKESEIKEKRIAELEKDKQIIAINSILKGEEIERLRMARELHDGLGGLLSGVRLSLSGIKGNAILDENGIERFSNAIALLDNSITELRRVAHNLMPEALIKFGLNEALNDYCSKLSDNGKCMVRFQSFGKKTRLEKEIEISIYRIIQELVNNALKHADASEILVQKIQEDTRLHVTVQDNGKGFDVSVLNTSKGNGLSNVKNRIESLNGKLDVTSRINEGAEFSVEIEIKPNKNEENIDS